MKDKKKAEPKDTEDNDVVLEILGKLAGGLGSMAFALSRMSENVAAREQLRPVAKELTELAGDIQLGLATKKEHELKNRKTA